MAKTPPVEVENRAHGDIQSLQELDPQTMADDQHYRWVRADPLRIGKRRLMGYRFVTPDEGVKTLAGYLDDSSDGTMRIMDTVLMCCPLADWRARKRQQNRTANARLSAPKKQFKRNARRRKVRILNEEDE